MSQPTEPDETDPASQPSSQPGTPPEQSPPAAGGMGQGSGYTTPSRWTLADIPSPIMVSFADPAPQNRLTVLFRIFMAIPHLIVLYALNLALEIVAFIGWFAALFTGALPEWAHVFIAGVVRWQVRVYSYLFLLTDVYPPFSLDDAAYPVRLVTRPTRLNRLAVFFRNILAIPAAIVATIAAFGFFILSFFGWLIALVTGKLPRALHQAGAAIVRYQARYSGFLFMVTSEYPKRLYGDPPAPGFAAETGMAPGAATQAPDTTWQLTLSSAAKALVTVALVLGVLGIVAYSVLLGVVVSHSSGVTNALALVKVEQANNQLATTIDGFPAAVSACNGQLKCVAAEDRKLSAALETFVSTLRSISFSGSASAAAASLISDTSTAAQDLKELGAATSVSQYQSIATSGHVQQVLDNLGTDYNALIKDL